MNLRDQSETEHRLKQALEAAKTQYESTKRSFELALEPTNSRQTRRPSIQDLEEAHKEAMQKYRRALLDFNQFLLESRPLSTAVNFDGLASKPDGLGLGARGTPELKQ